MKSGQPEMTGPQLPQPTDQYIGGNHGRNCSPTTGDNFQYTVEAGSGSIDFSAGLWGEL